MTKAFVEATPRYRLTLEQQGLGDPRRVFALPALIVSGHPNRNVARIAVGVGPLAIHAFLKREHRVPWKDRLANACAGFGFVSRCQREFVILRSLRQAGIGCPDPIAAGEDGHGRAFLIVRELPSAVDLRTFLDKRRNTSAYHRYRFARRLGEALARVHDAGFDHPDLYAKHVLVVPGSESISFLDWQRSRQCGHVGWPQRWSSLAALDATLAADLASPSERLVCLRAYLRASAQIFLPRSLRMEAVRRIACRSQKLQRRRRIREQRHRPLAADAQSLIWLDDENLVVTRAFHEECRGVTPSCLGEPGPPSGAAPQRTVISLPGDLTAILVRRQTSCPGQWLWNSVRRRRFESPELQQAAALFRLQRFGVRTPRLLAFGQRHPRPWRAESFLLSEEPSGAETLPAWLRRQGRQPLWTAQLKQRRRLIAEAGDFLRRIHDAGYRGHRFTDRLFLVQAGVVGRSFSLVLGTLDGLDCRRRSGTARARRDVANVLRILAPALASRCDEMRFLRAYFGLTRLTSAAKDFLHAPTGEPGDHRRSVRPSCLKRVPRRGLSVGHDSNRAAGCLAGLESCPTALDQGVTA
jgi:hypothetical protein